MDFTEEDLSEVLKDLGHEWLPAEIPVLKQEIERFLSEREESSGDVSFIDLQPGQYEDSNGFHANIEEVVPAEPTSCRPDEKYTRKDGFSKMDGYEQLFKNGYRLLRDVNEYTAHLKALNDRLESQRFGTSCFLVCKEKQVEFSGHKTTELKEAHATETNSAMDDEKGTISDSNAVEVDPSIRPVLCPRVGGLPFRHDPVKKYELYKKEWQSNPPPGENKRLSLRWTVREYMLRNDIPKLTPADLAKRRESNPPWSPRPYMD